MDEKDEDKKTEIKEQATKSLPDLLDKISQWVEGDFVLGAKLSLADLAILDVMSVVNKFLPEFEPPEAIKKVLKNVNENAGIKKWLESRPISENKTIEKPISISFVLGTLHFRLRPQIHAWNPRLG